MLKTVKRDDLRKKSHNFKILFIRCLCPAVVRRVNKKKPYPVLVLVMQNN